jgi:molybdenum cofactor cytidylyltransferase
MGRPKLLLEWGQTTILGHLLKQWQRADARQIAVVCSNSDSAVRTALQPFESNGVECIFNPKPQEGMFSSIRCAARWTGWTPDLTHFVITLGDQPLVRLETLRRLIAFGAAHPENICQPAREARARHPVLMPRKTFTLLRDASESDLKQFLLNRAEQRSLFESDDPGLDFDLDRPEDYARALGFMNECPT